MKEFAGAKKLSRLELRDTSVGDDAMEVIAGMPAVTYLELNECRLVSSEGFQKLGTLSELKELHLWETKFDDAAMEAISGLSKLENLNLEATKISNKTVKVLAGFKNLTKLNIAGTRLDDDAAPVLKTLPKLVWINVGNSSMSYYGIDELIESKETLEVIE